MPNSINTLSQSSCYERVSTRGYEYSCNRINWFDSVELALQNTSVTIQPTNFIENNSMVVNTEGFYDINLISFKKIERKYILDLKTIKKFKFKWKLVDKMKKSDWELYYLLKNTKVPFVRGSSEEIQLRNLRARIKSNIRFKVDMNDEIGTYVTFNAKTGLPVEFDNKLSMYKYILTRMKEKIRIYRTKLGTNNVDKASPKQVILGISPTIGLVRLKHGEFFQRRYYQYIDHCFDAKVPTTDEKYIGIEMEMFTKFNHHELAKKLATFYKNINIKDDCSIEIDSELYDESCDCGDEYCEEDHQQTKWKAVELNILMTEQEFKDGMLLKICKILDDIDARTNESCGLHVHLDMRNRDVKKSFYNLTMCQDLLFNLVESHRKNTTYVRKVETSDFNLEPENHYNAINGQDAFNKFQTIEVRIHHGSVDYKEISSWISLLLKIVDCDSLLDKSISESPWLLSNAINVDHEVKTYYSLGA